MKGKLTFARVAGATALVIAAAVVVYVKFTGSLGPIDRAARDDVASAPAVERSTPTTRTTPRLDDGNRGTQALDSAEEDAGSGEQWKNAHIEEIKRALYQREIESVEDLHLLDEFVHLGDADTRDFWNTDWSGVDDFKRNQDGFSLEKLDDGTLVFVPGEETRRIYSFFETMNVYDYDEATQEFVYETDYYGKPIVNIVKFLREDVMVLMVVSGQKVDMNIYELNADRRDR